MWNREEIIFDDELEVSPKLTPPLGPPRNPRIAIGALDNFFHEIRSELGRVTWPTFAEVRIIMTIVLSVILFFSVFLNGVDQILLWLGRLSKRLLEAFGIG